MPNKNLLTPYWPQAKLCILIPQKRHTNPRSRAPIGISREPAFHSITFQPCAPQEGWMNAFMMLAMMIWITRNPPKSHILRLHQEGIAGSASQK
ncbi:hypothetical protein AB1N83_006419 [Pleurotus pulmonarius]